MIADPSVAGMYIRTVLAFRSGATASDSATSGGAHEYSWWREAGLAVGVVLCCVAELQVLWLSQSKAVIH